MDKSRRAKRKAMVLDKDQIAAAAELVEKVVRRQPHGSDFRPIHRLAPYLDNLAGKTLEEFLELAQDVRDELHRAAKFIGRKFCKPECLHGFLRHIVGILKKSADEIAKHGRRIALFLIAIISPERASRVCTDYLHA